MHRYRFSHLVIALLLILDTPAASFAATIIYAQTIKGVIYKSTDSAKTWQAVGTPTLPNTNGVGQMLAVDPQNTNNLYTRFVTSGTKQQPGEEGINRSADGGQTWTGTVFAAPAAPPLVVDATMGNIIYIAGTGSASGARSWRSTDYGATFQAGTSPVVGKSIKTYPNQPGVVYLVGESLTTTTGTVPKGIYKSTDYGVSWDLLVNNSTVFGNASGSIADLAVDPNNSSVLYVAAYSSGCGPGLGTAPCGLIKSTDAGKTWQPVFADDCANVVVDPRNGNVYAGCYLAGTATIRPSGEVAKSTDGGKTFTKLSSGLTRLGVEVHLDPESPNVLYGSQSRILGVDTSSGALQPAGVFVSTDSGATWTLSTVDPTLQRPNDQIYSLVALSIKNPPPGVVNVSAAGGRTDLFAPDAIVSAFGAGLAGVSLGASTIPPPTTLGGATVTVTDSAGTSQPAELLYVSSGQINYIVPDGLAAGAATVAFNSGSSTQTQKIRLGPVAPGMFTFGASGLVAGSVLRVSADGTQTTENLFQMDAAGNVVALPINLGPATDQVFLILYGTGFRAAGTANTTMTIGGQNAQVSFAGDQGAFAGLDQVNVLLPRSLAGKGSVNIVFTASGQTANTVNISVQ